MPTDVHAPSAAKRGKKHPKRGEKSTVDRRSRTRHVIPLDEYQGLRDPRLIHMTAAGKKLYFRLKLWERDDGRCGVCGDPVSPDAMEIDHILPRSRGGGDHWDNLRPSHGRCNRLRGHIITVEDRCRLAGEAA